MDLNRKSAKILFLVYNSTELINKSLIKNIGIIAAIGAIILGAVYFSFKKNELSAPPKTSDIGGEIKKELLFAVFSGEKYFWFVSEDKGKISESKRDDSFSADYLDIIDLSGYRGTLSGKDDSGIRQEADFIPFPSVVIGKDRLSDYSPVISEITDIKSYSDEIASELDIFGLTDKDPETKKSILADIDNDGKEEAFIRISGRSDKKSREKVAPLYDLLFMVQGSDRSVHSINIDEKGVPEISLSHDIAAITDVDNDGEPELVISYDAEKCSGGAVFKFYSGKPELMIKKTSCD